MSKRLAFDVQDINQGPGILQSLRVKGTHVGNMGLRAAKWIAQKTGRTGWVVLTTACVTLLPLYFEITREAQMIEQEKMQVKAMIAEGKTRHDIAAMGLVSALDPNILGTETPK